jgi:hypothetical protein
MKQQSKFGKTAANSPSNIFDEKTFLQFLKIISAIYTFLKAQPNSRQLRYLPPSLLIYIDIFILINEGTFFDIYEAIASYLFAK